MSTTTRTLIGFLLILAVGYYLLLDRLMVRVERQYMEAAEEPMVDMAHVLAGLLGRDFAERDFSRLREEFEEIGRRQFEARIYDVVKRSVDTHIYVTDAEGVVLFDSRGEAEGKHYGEFNDVRRTLRGEYGARSTRTDEGNDLTSVMYVGAPLRREGRIVGMVSVSKPQASMFEFIEDTHQRIMYVGWSIFVATMLAAVLVAHWFSGPVRKLTDYARAVRRGERVVLPRLGGSDMKVLGEALEEMRDSLEDRKYVESYVQTLTHEMKSPVAAIRGAVELLQEEGMPAGQRARFQGNIRTETDRLQNIIDRLLALSAIESRKSLENSEEIVLTELVEEICASHEHALEAKGLRVERRFEVRPVVRGEAFLLEIAIGNLLQNAIDFSSKGGVVTVGVRAGSGEGTVEVVVEDAGPGIPDYAKDRVFDRFYSLRHPDTGRKSSGLGLCFVREAAELHGGEAKLENREEGVGARAVLVLGGVSFGQNAAPIRVATKSV